MAEKITRMAVILCCVLMAAACGYSFKAGGEYIDKGIQTVFVDVFVNKTSEANIENTFRAAFIDQFIQALGASGSPNQSNKQIGMQFANAGLQATQIPTVPLMQNVNQQTIQRQAPQTFNPLIQMLLNGGR